MTTENRLAQTAPVRTKETPQEIADRMNAYTRGQKPGHNGEFIPHPRYDVRWIVRDGRCVIEMA